MQKTYRLALHIFRRDLRLQDNTALISALKNSDHVIPCFIFDPRQIETNDYKSDNAIDFMCQSLAEISNELKKLNSHLYIFYGIAEEVIAKLLDENKIDAVFINRDYTPFSIKRDKNIEKYCKQYQVDFHTYADALLHEPEAVIKSDHTPYTIFTPFSRKAAELAVTQPQRNTSTNYYQATIHGENDSFFQKILRRNNPKRLVKGGREEAKKLLTKIKDLKHYDDLRNIPAENGTTKLSAHIKFGTLSIREVYYYTVKQFSNKHTLITELLWRDFFTHIGYHYPKVFETSFREKYRNLAWQNNEKYFQAWCSGNTGYPMVDAGMRELNTTGFMHNRVRMITASFLVKDLHIDWRWGEKYFANLLTDYDPAVNNGNWQWAASTGCDAQPYFRIFNPWLQQEKFDPEYLYVKKWIPELANIENKMLKNLKKNPKNLLSNYPPPIVQHEHEISITKRIYS